MTDTVDSATRSRIMAAIPSKNTKPELLVRRELFRRGFRYTLHKKGMPGSPDLLFRKYHAVIFVNGCFWHGHGCGTVKLPASNSAFWKQKIIRNRKRDDRSIAKLLDSGWRVMTVWECAFNRRHGWDISVIGQQLTDWLQSKKIQASIHAKRRIGPSIKVRYES